MIATFSASDTQRMQDSDFQTLFENPHCQRLLQKYQQLSHELPRQIEPTGSDAPELNIRWFPRVNTVESVPTSEIARLHGTLIAYGWLNFQFDDEQGGVIYRISADGKRILKQLSRAAEADSVMFDNEMSLEDDEFELSRNAEHSILN